jgi:hypothetical protein
MWFDFFLEHFSETFPILTRIQRDIILNLHTFSYTVQVILVNFKENLIF